ncbi:MAG: AAA family ATPase [Thermodesulfobacteriota bacterium]|nr:AAA family ATPase [Thermodesulfobacteriota bacterium]
MIKTTPKLKKLPIGIQTFEKIREDDYLYIDKTRLIAQLVAQGSYYFLARPHRFGKSLLISTLQALFEGREELFQGLAIHDQWDWNVKYPVIKISFGGVARDLADMKQDVKNILRQNQEKYLSDGRSIYLVGIDFDSENKTVAGFEWEMV